MKTEIITSAQNPKIKTLLELQEKSKARRREGLFVVEGVRELLHCIEAGCRLPIVLLLAATSQYYCNQLLTASARCTVSAPAVTSCYKKAGLLLILFPSFRLYIPVE
jgi:tRNA G18 (ribose-2'-O)-methylase SpoU